MCVLSSARLLAVHSCPEPFGGSQAEAVRRARLLPGAPGPALAAVSRDEEPVLAQLPVSLAWTARQSVPESAASSTDTLRASLPSLVLSA